MLTDRNKSNYKEEYQRGYEQGLIIGAREGMAETIVRLYKIQSKEETDNVNRSALKIIKQFYRIDDNYEKEILAVIKRHPNYSEAHLAAKILYECSYLPCPSK